MDEQLQESYQAYNAYEERAGTILCEGESFNAGVVGLSDPSGTRRWTIRELAALQTFPATRIFCDGKVTKKPARRIIGNAVPPYWQSRCSRRQRQVSRLRMKTTGNAPHRTGGYEEQEAS